MDRKYEIWLGYETLALKQQNKTNILALISYLLCFDVFLQ